MKLPQLTLRDLFWLVLVAACLCGWYVDGRRHEAIHQRDMDERQKDLQLLEEQAYSDVNAALERYKAFRQSVPHKWPNMP